MNAKDAETMRENRKNMLIGRVDTFLSVSHPDEGFSAAEIGHRLYCSPETARVVLAVLVEQGLATEAQGHYQSAKPQRVVGLTPEAARAAEVNRMIGKVDALLSIDHPDRDFSPSQIGQRVHCSTLAVYSVLDALERSGSVKVTGNGAWRRYQTARPQQVAPERYVPDAGEAKEWAELGTAIALETWPES